MTKSREIRLKSRPTGMPEAANFELASVEVPPPGAAALMVAVKITGWPKTVELVEELRATELSALFTV